MAIAAPLNHISSRVSNRRLCIATVSSVGFHALVVVVVGLLAVRGPVGPELLIPVELMFAEQPRPAEMTVGGGQPEAPPKTQIPPIAAQRSVESSPSSAGGSTERASAAPRILTAESSEEPAGPVGEGREPAGPAGEVESPAGPSYGPSVVGGPVPIYPKDAADQALEGEVTLSVIVGEDGSVESVTVENSSGHQLLDAAAIRAVRERWVFQPGMAGGRPERGEVTLTFDFSAGMVKRG